MTIECTLKLRFSIIFLIWLSIAKKDSLPFCSTRKIKKHSSCHIKIGRYSLTTGNLSFFRKETTKDPGLILSPYKCTAQLRQPIENKWFFSFEFYHCLTKVARLGFIECTYKSVTLYNGHMELVNNLRVFRTCSILQRHCQVKIN